MSFDLSERQVGLLQAIIKEYLESSSPVGSQTIVERYNFKCSAATVRNEMSDLMHRGFLVMAHTSSGRKPSPMAYRFFIDTLLEEDDIPILQEVAIKQRLWPSRYEFEKLLRYTVSTLADSTHTLAYATTNDGFSVYSGAANILDNIEFWDINTARTALGIVDRHEILNDLLSKASYGAKDIQILMGDEILTEGLEESAFVFSKYTTGKNSGFVGIFGPARMKYSYAIPTVRYTKKLVEELSQGW